MSNNKLILPIGLIAIATILVGAFYFKVKVVQSPEAEQNNNIQTAGSKENSEPKLEEIALPAPTGNVGDAMEAVLGDIASEDVLVAEENDEALEAADEAKDTSDLNELYDEKEL